MRLFAQALLAALLASASSAWAQQSPTVDVGGAKLEIDAIVVGHRLPMNGAGVHSENQAKLYAAALYVSRKARTLAEVTAAPGPKRLHLQALKEIDGKALGTALSQGMTANLSASESSACLPGLLRLGEVLAAKKRLASGDSLSLDAVPGQGTVVRLNGDKAAAIESKEFFGCMLQVYLGAKPTDEALKPILLGAAR